MIFFYLFSCLSNYCIINYLIFYKMKQVNQLTYTHYPTQFIGKESLQYYQAYELHAYISGISSAIKKKQIINR